MIKGIFKMIFRILTVGFRYNDYKKIYARRSAATKIIFTSFFTLLAAACIAGEIIICETMFNGAFADKSLLIAIIGIPVTAALGFYGFGYLSKCSLAAFTAAGRIKKENKRIREQASAPVPENNEGIETVSGEYVSANDNEIKSPALDTAIGVFTMLLSLGLIAAVIIIPLLYLKSHN